jgi:hypothetical protein
MTLGVMSIALAINFWTSNPTFNPYGFDKNVIGGVFFTLGFSKLVFLNVLRDLRLVRIILAASISFHFFWGASNAQQFFAGKASLQLPILYIALAVLQMPLLVEAPVNPMTEKK